MIVCAMSWIVVGVISLLVLLNGALSHSEKRKDRANRIIIALIAANGSLNAFVVLKKRNGNRRP